MGMDLTVSEFSKTVNSIYGAVFDHGCWDQALGRLQKLFRSDKLILGVTDPTSYFHTVTMDVSHDFDPKYKKLYDEHYYRTNYLIYEDFASGIVRNGRIRNYAKLDDTATFRKSEFAEDYLRPQGVYHVASACIALSDRVFGLFTLGRDRKWGEYSDDEEALLREFLPHLQRAIVQEYCISGLKCRKSELEKGLDLLPVGFVVLDESGRVLFMNCEANRIVKSEPTLYINRNGKMCLANELGKRLAHVIKKTVDISNGTLDEPRTAFSVDKTTTPNGLSLMISPICIEKFDSTLIPTTKARAIVLISDPDRHPDKATASQRLRGLYGMTKSETNVILQLLRGQSNAEIAENLGISEYTVKTYVQRALEKTRKKRRGELISLVRGDCVVSAV